MKTVTLLGLATLLTVVSCTPQQPAGTAATFTDQDAADIREVVDTWVANTAANRFMDNLDLYSEDAVELLTPPVVGKEAIRAHWESFLPRYQYEGATGQVRELVGGLGNDAYAWVQFQDTELYDGELRVRDGHWMILFRKEEDGTWRIYRSLWSAAVQRPDSAAATS